MAKQKSLEHAIEKLTSNIWGFSDSALSEATEQWAEQWGDEAYNRVASVLSSPAAPVTPAGPWQIAAWLRRLNTALGDVPEALSEIALQVEIDHDGPKFAFELYNRKFEGEKINALAARIGELLYIPSHVWALAVEQIPFVSSALFDEIQLVDVSRILRDREVHPIKRLLEDTHNAPDGSALDDVLAAHEEDIVLAFPLPPELPESLEPDSAGEWLREFSEWIANQNYEFNTMGFMVKLVLDEHRFVAILELCADNDLGFDEIEDEDQDGENESEGNDTERPPVPLPGTRASHLAARIIALAATEEDLARLAALVPQIDPEILRFCGGLFVPGLPAARHIEDGYSDEPPGDDAPLHERMFWLSCHFSEVETAEDDLEALIRDHRGQLLEQIGSPEKVGPPDPALWPNQMYRITEKAWKKWLGTVDEALYACNEPLENVGLSVRAVLDTHQSRFGARMELIGGEDLEDVLQGDAAMTLAREIADAIDLRMEALEGAMRSLQGERLDKAIRRLSHLVVLSDED